MTAQTLVATPAFTHAYHSLRNSGHALLEFAYGTPARANMTLIFALGVAVLGALLNASGTSEFLTVCAQ